MKALLGKALFVTCLGVGFVFATACSGDPANIDLNGGWRYLTEDNAGSQAQVASQFAGEGQVFANQSITPQDFNITQSSDGTLSANFVDQWSNQVNMWGQMTGGRFTAMWDVLCPDGRQLTYSSIGNFSPQTLTIDGWTVNMFDSAGLAYNFEEPFWMVATSSVPQNELPGEVTPEEAEILRNCAQTGLEICFIMDTSGSMGDESQALCDAISSVENGLAPFGFNSTNLRISLLAITGNPPFGGGFSCLQDSVANLFGTSVPTAVPGTAPSQVLNSSEDWGPGTAVVAGNKEWLPGAIRMVVPISDEGPENGGGEFGCDAADTAAIDNAIAVANMNNVIVSPIVAALNISSGIDPQSCILAEATRLAQATGGSVQQSTDPSLDIPQSIVNTIIAACRPTD